MVLPTLSLVLDRTVSSTPFTQALPISLITTHLQVLPVSWNTIIWRPFQGYTSEVMLPRAFEDSLPPKLWHFSFVWFGTSFISGPLRSTLAVHSHRLFGFLKGCEICMLGEYTNPVYSYVCIYVYIYQSREYPNPTQYFYWMFNGTLTNASLKHCFIALVNAFKLSLTASLGLEGHSFLTKGSTCPQLCYIGNNS